MLEDFINNLKDKANDAMSQQLIDQVLKEAKEVAKKDNNGQLTEDIVNKVADRMINTGDYLKKLTDDSNPEWLLNKIVDEKFCAACGACEIVCPNNFVDFDEGPSLGEYCRRLGHGMCHEVCPRVFSGRYQISIREDFFEEYYYAKGSDDGQDGGVITTFLKDLINKGKIDGAIVVGDVKWKPISLIIKDADALDHSAKSKYAISPLSALKKAGEMGLEKVAVVGLPCQVEGLRKYQYYPYLAKHSSEIGDEGYPVKLPKIEYLIGLFCTEKFTLDAIKKVCADNEVDIGDVKKFDVTNGKFIIETEDKTIDIPVKDIETFSGCEVCRDFASDLADVSIGNVGSPDGYSTVIVRTEKGKDIADAVDLQDGADKDAIDKLAEFKLNRFRKNINERIENKEFVSYYWNDYKGGSGIRSDGNYFIRVRAKPSGFYQLDETEYINKIAKEYDARIKLTNRGTYELHDIKPIDVEAVTDKLDEHDLLTGSEGPLVRATLACPGQFNCHLGLIPTTALCYELEEKFSEMPANYKFKIAINGCPNKCSRPQVHDFGIAGITYPKVDAEKCNGCGRCEDVCKVNAPSIRGEMSYTNYTICYGCGKCIKACPHDARETKFHGYEIYVGGKTGREVVEGVRLELETTDEIVDLISKVIKTYNRLAIKPQKERLAATMKRIGQAQFMEEVKKLD
ncbi:MAG: Coenzyme F420 hydrogenase/dehydrogenase, beta subunit C-terminal domain [Methanobrevibacter sp.]|uniref:Coenzyme F420 hydrogenase/dehydrogenase, beta subunit C-terminal domain n=1 Tax=Methanobrevibacter sp. TaxID=66852 RepID=UPI0026DEE7A3|nr:Coenzyme F420 hydrogenase/dehydrogenase, beta subunit C-terminal domain [Methanobrevibacter sp.]MDO5848001.1 Coenzyme F420 hydrogenase/dehydrogenase, beta subunit C-terminal domain [Methanobrevibacter sp.]